MKLVVAILLAVTARAVAEPACKPADGAVACKQQCDKGSQASCAVLGVMHLQGIAGKVDHAQAERLLQRACTAKIALGCGGLGSYYGAIKKDWKRARPLLEQGCTMGDALSCESIGGIINGADPALPRPKDLGAAARESFPFYKRACDLGAANGCGFSAVFIADKLVTGTVKQALELYMKACSGGMSIACRQGAALLVRKDPEARALAASLDAARLVADLLKRGCALGDQPSCSAKP